MTTTPHPTTSQLVEQFSNEPDYSDPSTDDFEALARDTVPTRSLKADDLKAVIKIDQHVTGQDRSSYYERKFDEALLESGIRVSLVAELEDQVVGFVMARVDYGAFGLTATSAVIDTIGVDPAYNDRGVGRALVSQLLTNLSSLRVEAVRTEVDWNSFKLLRFLERCGFKPSQELSFAKSL